MKKEGSFLRKDGNPCNTTAPVSPVTPPPSILGGQLDPVSGSCYSNPNPDPKDHLDHVDHPDHPDHANHADYPDHANHADHADHADHPDASTSGITRGPDLSIRLVMMKMRKLKEEEKRKEIETEKAKDDRF
ncbi:hypothetical protein Q3G72_032526 [Acer saccharum]|nr:hypothetical protein Q3G72_032526 [Acer saccharum]